MELFKNHNSYKEREIEFDWVQYGTNYNMKCDIHGTSNQNKLTTY